MKYLKLYEDLKSDNYNELSRRDFIDKVYGLEPEKRFDFITSNWVDFSENEINIINTCFKCKLDLYQAVVTHSRAVNGTLTKFEKGKPNVSYNGNGSTNKFFIGASINLNTLLRINIYKLKDDWYYIKCGRHYYKCDQLDGFVDCINHISNMIEQIIQEN